MVGNGSHIDKIGLQECAATLAEMAKNSTHLALRKYFESVLVDFCNNYNLCNICFYQFMEDMEQSGKYGEYCKNCFQEGE